MMKPHDGDAWIKRVLDVPTKPRTRRPPLSEKDRKWSQRKIEDQSMEKNSLQHTYQYLWAKINKT